MRKAVAVPYVIALILGVAVIGLIGIWIATTGGKFGGQSTKTICDNKFVAYCVTNPSGTYGSFKSGTECEGVSGSFLNCGQAPSVAGRGSDDTSGRTSRELAKGNKCGTVTGRESLTPSCILITGTKCETGSICKFIGAESVDCFCYDF